MIRNFTDHAANERTFLAWVRTVIAVVGFGIAASRIGGVTAPNWVDALVLVAGVLVIVLAYLRMQLVRRRIDSTDKEDDEAARADLMLVVMIMAFFVLLAGFAIRLSM